MKARVKATGEIVEVNIDYRQDADYVSTSGQLYQQRELDFNVENKDPDYWEKLLHQYAGMAMQGYIIAAHLSHFSFCENDMKDCVSMATALVNKLKGDKI